jgi:hypothetical protein
VGQPEGKRLIGRPRCRGKNNMIFKEIGFKDVDFVYWLKIAKSGWLL